MSEVKFVEQDAPWIIALDSSVDFAVVLPEWKWKSDGAVGLVEIGRADTYREASRIAFDISKDMNGDRR